MIRTDARHESDLRIAELRAALSRAVMAVYENHHQALTHEEIIVALSDLNSRWAQHLMLAADLPGEDV